MAYRSQLAGLGGSAVVLRDRQTKYARHVGNGRPCERYWFATSARAGRTIENAEGTPPGPFMPRTKQTAGSTVRRILSLVRGIELIHLLPPGVGDCLDLSRTEDVQAAINARGYRCVSTAGTPGRLAAVVSWEPMGRSVAEQLIREAFVLLEPGGVLVGRLSRQETEGTSWPADYPEEFLRRQGFRDVQMRPGRRGPFPNPPLARLKQLLKGIGLVVRIGARFVGRWRRRPSPPNEDVVLALADHMIFVARKAAVRLPCT